MNHWIKKREARKTFSIRISSEGHTSSLENVSVFLRESLNTLEICVNTDKQKDDELVEFYEIIGNIFIDLSSFTRPAKAKIIIMPNDLSKDGYVLADAVATSANFGQLDATSGDTKCDIIFSYTKKSAIQYINI